MYEPIKHEGIFIDYKSDEDLLYKDIYSNKLSDVAFVNVYHKGKFATMAYVWCDNEVGGREYIEINHTVVYLDTIKTLVSVDDFIQHICNQYEVTLAELRSDDLHERLREPRLIIYYVLREEYGMIWQTIADKLHRLSHATVMSGHKRVKGFMEVSGKYADTINALILTEYRKQEELELN
jgi:hypothetical protein